MSLEQSPAAPRPGDILENRRCEFVGSVSLHLPDCGHFDGPTHDLLKAVEAYLRRALIGAIAKDEAEGLLRKIREHLATK